MKCLACGQYSAPKMTPGGFQVVIEGKPMPKKRPIVTRNGTYMPAPYTKWKKDVAIQAKATRPPLLDCPVSVEVALSRDFAVVVVSEVESTRPKGLTGDTDNYAGAYMDALQGIMFGNDRAVHDIRGRFVL